MLVALSGILVASAIGLGITGWQCRCARRTCDQLRIENVLLTRTLEKTASLLEDMNIGWNAIEPPVRPAALITGKGEGAGEIDWRGDRMKVGIQTDPMSCCDGFWSGLFGHASA